MWCTVNPSSNGIEIGIQAQPFLVERTHTGLDRFPVTGAAGVPDALAHAGNPVRANHPAGAQHAVGRAYDLENIAGGHGPCERGSVFIVGAAKVRENVALGGCVAACTWPNNRFTSRKCPR